MRSSVPAGAHRVKDPCPPSTCCENRSKPSEGPVTIASWRERGGRVQAAAWALEPVARQRQEQLRQESARCRRRAPRDTRRWRERLGWALVELGLRLAGGRAGAPGGPAP